MRKMLYILMFVLVLWPVGVFAEWQRYRGYVPDYGNSLEDRGKGRLQTYKNYLPKYGDYYKWDGRKYQHYDNYIPHYGHYLDGKGQVYRNYLPEYGDYYR